MDAPESDDNPMLFNDRVGDRLRSARERAGADLEDIAARTRIPLRHLKAIETSDYDKLPSVTYAVGFAKTFARAVNLDDAEIGRALRVELGASAPRSAPQTQSYEPVDPARLAPTRLAWTALALAVLVIGGYGVWRYMHSGADVVPSVEAPVTDNGIEALGGGNVAVTPSTANSAAPSVAVGGNTVLPAAVPAPASAAGPVVLTATGPVWLRVYDDNDKVFIGRELKPGESFTVPADAQNPQIRTANAENIKVTIGGQPVAALGPAQRLIKDVGVSAAALRARAAPGGAATPTR